MYTAHIKNLLFACVIIGALSSLTAFACMPVVAHGNGDTIFPQDTTHTTAPKHRNKPNTNQNNTPGNDLNNAGSSAQVRHERTGSLNPYSTGTVKSHEGTQGTTGPSGR